MPGILRSPITQQTTKRTWLTSSLGLQENPPLSTSDLEYRFYAANSGLTRGSLADHRKAYINNLGYKTFSDFLQAKYGPGPLSSLYFQFYSALSTSYYFSGFPSESLYPSESLLPKA